jgi:hypothetical protein
MAGKCGILPFMLARLFAGGISDYRLRRLIEDETLARKEDGLDADQFFVALAQQEEIRDRSGKAGRREDRSARLLLAFTPGFLEVWEAGGVSRAFAGLDYDVAIRDAIVEGSGDPAAAAAIEARYLAAVRRSNRRKAGGPEAIGSGHRHRLAERSALAGPSRLAGQFGSGPSVAGFYPSARAALETALSLRRWNSSRPRPAHRPRRKRSDPRRSAVLGGQGAAFQSAVRRRGERAHRRHHRPV